MQWVARHSGCKRLKATVPNSSIFKTLTVDFNDTGHQAITIEAKRVEIVAPIALLEGDFDFLHLICGKKVNRYWFVLRVGNLDASEQEHEKEDGKMPHVGKYH
jgi:hypothetical protein